MAESRSAKIGIDDLVESAAHGVLRALEARNLGKLQVEKNGFVVDIIIRAGGFPLGDITAGLPAIATAGKAVK